VLIQLQKTAVPETLKLWKSVNSAGKPQTRLRDRPLPSFQTFKKSLETWKLETWQRTPQTLYYRHSNDHYHKEGNSAFVLLKSPSGLWAVHREGRAVCTAELKTFLPHKVRWTSYDPGVAGFLRSDMILKKVSSLFAKDENSTASDFFSRTRQSCSLPSRASNNRESPALGQSQAERKSSVKVMDDEEVEPRVDKYSKITAGISCGVNM
jgi:hypothetical protein